MSLASVFNIAGTGMSAQSTRLNTISSNIANADTPGYVARDFNFATTLQAAQGDNGSVRQALQAASTTHSQRRRLIVCCDTDQWSPFPFHLLNV